MGLSITSRGLRPIADTIDLHRRIVRMMAEEKLRRTFRVPTRRVDAPRPEITGTSDLADCRPDVVSFSMA
jgi:hypothetical protein